jgi:2-polyprenyl-3-methyl-5-hydroxy-6-metoxy-1,4-benzoquinol methylase
MYNKTQLNPDTTFERHVYHRDQFAHYLRWTHVLKRARIGMKVLDFGCGSGNLLEVFYRNRFKLEKYLGLDVREKTIEQANEKFKMVPWSLFKSKDLCGDIEINNDWDMICSFEVVEHIGKQNIDKFLQNIKSCCNENTKVLISTPNYDEKVGAAGNHIIDGKICEFEHSELQEIIEKYFTVEEKYGTFASQKDYKGKMNDSEMQLFEKLGKYYDTNLMSVIFAPLFPEESRNCLWILKTK